MHIAEILSDLTSLKVCEPAAALALVSARPAGETGGADGPAKSGSPDDADLQRAKDLVGLHQAVKLRHEGGRVDDELLQARGRVKMALRGLG